MWLKVAAIAALCVIDAVAQPPAATIMENCTTQDNGEMFRWCLDANNVVPPTRLFWNPANADGVISFAFEAPAGPWRAVGFSDAGAMAPANVVMGCIPPPVAPAVAPRNFAETPAGADFVLTARNSGGVNLGGNQNLVAYTQTLNDTLCTIRFQRPVMIEGLPMQQLDNRVQNVIAARGADGDMGIGQHPGGAQNGRGSFTVNFAVPIPLDPGMPGGTTQMEGTNAPAGSDASTLTASVTLLSAIVGSIYAALW